MHAVKKSYTEFPFPNKVKHMIFYSVPKVKILIILVNNEKIQITKVKLSKVILKRFSLLKSGMTFLFKDSHLQAKSYFFF